MPKSNIERIADALEKIAGATADNVQKPTRSLGSIFAKADQLLASQNECEKGEILGRALQKLLDSLYRRNPTLLETRCASILSGRGTPSALCRMCNNILKSEAIDYKDTSLTSEEVSRLVAQSLFDAGLWED